MKHGMLLIAKQSGMTSHDVVAKARRILKTKEIGHAGTLDPMAEGLMLLLIGEGTKLSQFLLEKDKRYRVQFRLGETSDTLDSTGFVTASNVAVPAIEKIKQAILEIQGEMNLSIPRFSAKQVDGQRLYDLARQGVEFTAPKKIMKFWNIEIHKLTATGGDVSLSCSKGSFIRSWVSELGDRLGCGALMSGLVRTHSHPYNLESATTLDELAENENQTLSDKKAGSFVSLSEMLPEVKRVLVSGQDEKLLMNGLISHQLRSTLITRFQPDQDEFIQIQSKSNHNLIAIIGLAKEKGFQIRRVMKPETAASENQIEE
ncbi:MAG: tRNA pseudouridine(55) synthase TruB [Pseudobdellovibrionaceae bacterium]